MTPEREAAIRRACGDLADALVAAVADAAPDPGAPDRLLSIPDVALALGGVTRSTVYQELAAGRLKGLKVGRRRFVSAAAVREYVEHAGQHMA